MTLIRERQASAYQRVARGRRSGAGATLLKMLCADDQPVARGLMGSSWSWTRRFVHFPLTVPPRC